MNAIILTEGRPVILRPQQPGWIDMGEGPLRARIDAIDLSMFALPSHRITVISSVEDIPGDGPSWHVSVAVQPSTLEIDRRPRRAPEGAIKRVFAAFGLDGWGFDEDNHAGPNAVVRNFWLQCARDRRAVCHCKDEERPTIQQFGSSGEDGGEYVHRPDNEVSG